MTTLSFRWNVPIYPILMKGNGEKSILSISDTLIPQKIMDSMDYNRFVFTQLYALLEYDLSDNLMAWEGWTYALPRFKKRGFFWDTLYTLIAPHRIWPLHINNSYYALDSQYMDSRGINRRMFNRLCRVKVRKLSATMKI